MAKLYYGNSSCTIEGSNIKGVQIQYSGAIEIDDKTSDNFAIASKNNLIIVFPLGDGFLNDLFSYRGEFKILSVIVGDNNGEKVPTTIHRVMDYSELLTTNAEDMTTNSEKLSSTHVSGNRVTKTTLKQPYIKSQHTSTYNGNLYLKDGSLYQGSFHIHISDNTTMTGREHTKDSQDLYFATGKPTKIKGHPYAVVEKNRKRKMQVKSKRKGY